MAIVFLVLSIAQMFLHYSEADELDNYLESSFSATIRCSAPKDAVVFYGEMSWMPSIYRKFVLRERTDVALADRKLLRGGFTERAWYQKCVIQQYPDAANVYYPARIMADEQMYTNDLIIHIVRRALNQGKPVVWLPLDDTDGEPQGYMQGRNINDLIDRNFDRVPWGICQRLYPKGAALGADKVFAANAPL